jgi:L-rhamnose mutarotase
MRVCFTSQVDPAHLAAYREAHANVWPEMLAALRQTGWSDYYLFLSPDGLLVGVVDLPVADGAPTSPQAAAAQAYAAAVARMATQPVNARWQAAMAALFASAGQPDQGMVVLEPIFHLESQLPAGRAEAATAPNTAA